MFTVRQIQRLWNDSKHRVLARELLANRPEASPRAESELTRTAAVAALALVRLDELSQGSTPLYPKLLRVVLASQETDGGWGDPLVSALCLRALLCGRGDGAAVERGLAYLANLQKAEGAWPRVPFRRMPADGYVSAFVLLQLGDQRRFRRSVRLADATGWFEHNAASLDEETRRLWEHARFRCRVPGRDPLPAMQDVRS